MLWLYYHITLITLLAKWPECLTINHEVVGLIASISTGL